MWAQKDEPHPTHLGPYPIASWKPDAAQLGLFAHALALRYGGTVAGLPRVRYFEVWDEPNLSQYLSPQLEGGKFVAAEVYRDLVNSFARAVHGVHGGNVVVAGSLSAFSFLTPYGRLGIAPLQFMRRMLCMSAGSAAARDLQHDRRLRRLLHPPLDFRRPDPPRGREGRRLARRSAQAPAAPRGRGEGRARSVQGRARALDHRVRLGHSTPRHASGHGADGPPGPLGGRGGTSGLEERRPGLHVAPALGPAVSIGARCRAASSSGTARTSCSRIPSRPSTPFASPSSPTVTAAASRSGGRRRTERPRG